MEIHLVTRECDGLEILAAFVDPQDAQAYADWWNLTNPGDADDAEAEARKAVRMYTPGEWEPTWPDSIQALMDRLAQRARDYVAGS